MFIPKRFYEKNLDAFVAEIAEIILSYCGYESTFDETITGEGIEYDFLRFGYETIACGLVESYADFVMEYEFLRLLKNNPTLEENEIFKLVFIKSFISITARGELGIFLKLATPLCTEETIRLISTRNKRHNEQLIITYIN